MNLTIVASWILMGSLAWMGTASLDVQRKQTLAKNMDWVLENPDFLRRHLRAPLWPLFALTLFCMVVIAFGFWSLPSLEAVYLKNGTILAAAGILCAVHGFQESRIAQAIPKPDRRSATLRPRSLENYAPKAFRWSADAALLLVSLGVLVAWSLGAVTAAFAVAVAISIATLVGVVAWGRWATLSERSPHFQQVRRITDKDLSENYRRFAVQLMLSMQLVVALLVAVQLAVQLAGWQLVHNPLQTMLQEVFGGQRTFPVLVRYEHYDAVVSILAAILVAWLPWTPAFADIRKINLVSLAKEETR
ncbi:MAG TPA: hypothetical protein PKO15_15550 [Fibrobacteria bacterium]|nr:hypothetical protein [Fibrobacteria bacterium]HOX52193.1 hypothetical protein [Fibrobacteria bacterium]